MLRRTQARMMAGCAGVMDINGRTTHGIVTAPHRLPSAAGLAVLLFLVTLGYVFTLQPPA